MTDCCHRMGQNTERRPQLPSGPVTQRPFRGGAAGPPRAAESPTVPAQLNQTPLGKHGTAHPSSHQAGVCDLTGVTPPRSAHTHSDEPPPQALGSIAGAN